MTACSIKYDIVLTLILLLVSPVFIMAQDSTAIKLQQYKDLHEKGLISDSEYEQLRKKELNLSEPIPSDVMIVKVNKDTIDLAKLKRVYKTEITSGSLELASGAGLFIAGVHFRNKPFYNDRGHQIGYHTKQARISFVCAAVFTGVGLFSVIKGGADRQKYIRLSGSLNSASLRIDF